MIRIRIERDRQDQRVLRVLVKGHAQYAEPGKDIVCAAVSGIVFGLVNAVEEMTGVVIHQPDDGDGKVDCSIPHEVGDVMVLAQITLLLEAMVISLRQVAEQYPQYIIWKEKR